jgi:hypothetical protein
MSDSHSRSSSRGRYDSTNDEDQENGNEIEVVEDSRVEQQQSRGVQQSRNVTGGLVPLSEIVQRNEKSSVATIRPQSVAPVLFSLTGKPALKEIRPAGTATNTFHFCCSEEPGNLEYNGSGCRVYLHSQFQNPNQLVSYYFRQYPTDTDPYFVLIDDRTANAGKPITERIPEWGTWRLRQFTAAEKGKRQILFLDFGLQTRGRIAAQGRWIVLERKKETVWEPVTDDRPTKMPPVQDWSEGFRQLEHDYGCVVWQISIKGKFSVSTYSCQVI